MSEGSWVGLDVHARSVVAGVLDGGSGELRTRRVPTATQDTVGWLTSLPGPVRVAYEAGPTGYGLARACAQAGIACTVAAPSRIRRAAADRVKTDRRDAELLARMLRMGELVAVRVPAPHEEAARDLVRAREDVRGDLMRARHRLSKLLLRHELVYDGSAWTLAHDAWLRRQRFDSRPLSLAFEDCYAAVLQTKTRRDALDQAMAPAATASPERRARASPNRPAGRGQSPGRSKRPTSPRSLARTRKPRQTTHHRRGRRRPRTRQPLLGTRNDRVSPQITGPVRRAQRRKDARSDPR